MAITVSGSTGVSRVYDYQTPSTGFSYTFASPTQVLILSPATTLATGTIITPSSPADGMTITISSTQTITSLTFSANSGQSISNAITTLALGSFASYLYRATNTTWYRVG